MQGQAYHSIRGRGLKLEDALSDTELCELRKSVYHRANCLYQQADRSRLYGALLEDDDAKPNGDKTDGAASDGMIPVPEEMNGGDSAHTEPHPNLCDQMAATATSGGNEECTGTGAREAGEIVPTPAAGVHDQTSPCAPAAEAHIMLPAGTLLSGGGERAALKCTDAVAVHNDGVRNVMAAMYQAGYQTGLLEGEQRALERLWRESASTS